MHKTREADGTASPASIRRVVIEMTRGSEQRDRARWLLRRFKMGRETGESGHEERKKGEEEAREGELKFHNDN